MYKSGVRDRQRYPFWEGQNLVDLMVVETWQRTPRRGPTLPQIDAVLPFARGIVDFLQGPHRNGYELAREMIKAKGHSLAFEVPDHVLAFGFLSKVRASRRDYVFHQLGVTTKDDLRGEHAAHGLADRHLRAVAAIVHTAVSDLPKGSRVFVEDHPEDERNGYFFNQVGFEPAEGAADWGTGRGLLVSPAHSIVQKMIETPEFAFVQSAGYSQ